MLGLFLKGIQKHMRTKQDKKTMEWLISERTRLQEELKEALKKDNGDEK